MMLSIGNSCAARGKVISRGIDCIDYVTGIGNGSRAPIETVHFLWYIPCCACWKELQEQLSQERKEAIISCSG